MPVMKLITIIAVIIIFIVVVVVVVVIVASLLECEAHCRLLVMIAIRSFAVNIYQGPGPPGEGTAQTGEEERGGIIG